MSDPTTYRVLSLLVENYRGISALMVKLDPGLNVIAGPNESGKTSALRALWAALGGGSAAWGETPIAVGHATASIDLVVVDRAGNPHCKATLKFRRGSEPKLEVSGADGRPIGAAATFLKSLVGAGIAWDPNAFADPRGETTPEGRNKQRMALLLRACPLSIDLGAHEAKRKFVFDRRRDANRDAKTLDAAVGPMVEADEPVPDVVDVSAMEVRGRLIETKNRDIDEYKRKADSERIALARITTARQEAETRLAGLKADEAETFTRIEGLDAAAAAPKTDTSALRQQLGEARKANETRLLAEQRNAQRAKDRARRAAARTAADEMLTKAEKLTADLGALDAEKAAAVASAKLPAGLTLDESGPVLDGLPFEDASGRRRLEVALAVGKCLSGPLRLLTLPDGNNFDRAAMVRLHEWCAAEGVQVVTERIEPDTDAAIELVEGHQVPA